jgi:hypothetical protein
MKWSLGRSTTIALLLSPVGILLISITRVLIISNYNTATASTVAASGGYVNTLVGTLIPIVPIFMPYLAVVLLFLNRAVLAVLAFLAAVLTSPSAISESHTLSIIEKNRNFVANHLGLFAFFLVLILFLEITAVPIEESVRTVTTIIGLALVPVVLTLYPLPLHTGFYKQQLQQPWLPAVVISLDSREKIVGYILSRDNGWFVVLIASDRTIDYVQAGQVVSQQVCQTSSTGTPLVPLFSMRAAIPICPGSALAPLNDMMHPPLRLDE